MPKRHGAIAASDPQTARAGAAMLDAGGNAIDAVVAAAFTSFVVEPPLTSPAGGGALLFGGRDRGWHLVDLMARTPGLGLDQRPELDFFGVEVDFGPTTQTFHIGRGSAAAPGLLRGLLQVHEHHGSLPLGELLEPAVTFAREGFRLSPAIQWVHTLLEPIVTLTPGIRSITCLGEELAPPGAELTNPELGDFIEAVGRGPQEALRDYHAALVTHFGPARGGLITARDLDEWVVAERSPLGVGWNGRVVLGNPPPAAGGGLVAFALRLADRAGLDGGAFLGPDHVALVASILGTISALRASGYDEQLADREAIEAMLDDPGIEQWDARRRAIDEERHLGSTTHISVADGRGGAASLTTSNGEGSGTVLPGFGVHVNNFLGEEDINPAGFHRFEPGVRMPTMMSPTIALDDGWPVLVLGSGGSNRIRSAVFQGLINALVFERPLDEAVNAPRLHVEGPRLWFEAADLAPETVARLEEDWPDATRFDRRNMFFGGVHAVGLQGGEWVGAGDRRRGGVAISR